VVLCELISGMSHVNKFTNGGLEVDRIRQGDCLELLETIPDNSVDMVFADPPFNLKKTYRGYSDNLSTTNYLQWSEKWIAEIVRVTKPSGSIFVHNIPKWLIHYAGFLNKDAAFKHWISWDAPSSPMGKSLQPSHYGILFYAKCASSLKFHEVRYPHKRDRKSSHLSKDYGGKKSMLHPFGPLVSDVWTDIHRVKHNKYRDEHPCQLPIHLLERLILMATDDGDVVLDPFSGTGTTAIAAKRMGRHYLGLELDLGYVESSERKLATETAVSKLGDRWVSAYLGRVVTLRDKDWEYLQKFYDLPNTAGEISEAPITLKKCFQLDW